METGDIIIASLSGVAGSGLVLILKDLPSWWQQERKEKLELYHRTMLLAEQVIEYGMRVLQSHNNFLFHSKLEQGLRGRYEDGSKIYPVDELLVQANSAFNTSMVQFIDKRCELRATLHEVHYIFFNNNQDIFNLKCFDDLDDFSKELEKSYDEVASSSTLIHNGSVRNKKKDEIEIFMSKVEQDLRDFIKKDLRSKL